jgi:hypothetical protein
MSRRAWERLRGLRLTRRSDGALTWIAAHQLQVARDRLSTLHEELQLFGPNFAALHTEPAHRLLASSMVEKPPAPSRAATATASVTSKRHENGNVYLA